MRLLARLYPEQFPDHAYWKADSTYPAFIFRSPTLDHIVPVAGGGDPLAPSNLVTACWGVIAVRSRPQEWCLIRSPRDLDSGLYAVMAVMVTSSSVRFSFVILVRRLLARMSRPR